MIKVKSGDLIRLNKLKDSTSDRFGILIVIHIVSLMLIHYVCYQTNS